VDIYINLLPTTKLSYLNIIVFHFLPHSHLHPSPEIHTMIFELLSLLVIVTFFTLTLARKSRKGPNLPPGPTPLPIIGHLHLIGPLIHHTFHNLASRYGPLMNIKLGSISVIVVSSPDLAREFLKTHEINFSMRASTIAIDCLTYNTISFAFAPYGAYWKFIKKISTFELLGNRMLNQFRPIRTEELHSLLRLLQQKSQDRGKVNLSQELLRFANNVICQMMLGLRASGTDGDAEVARGLARDVTLIFGEFNVSDFLWFLRKWDVQGFKRRSEDIRRRFDNLLEGIVSKREEQRRRNGGEKRRQAADFLDLMLDVIDDEAAEIKLTRDHVKALVLDFFVAGTDTSAASLEWALSELINYPRVLQKAREEIDRVVGPTRLVEESDGPNLVYINAVIKEAFRLHPSIPMITRKCVQECEIGGYRIPLNSMLFVNMWSIGRNPKYWDNPMEFRPERFLDNQVDMKGQHYELLPFGSGRRICAGMALALQELPAALAAVMQCFDFEIVKGEKPVDMSERPGLTVPKATDLVCVPTARAGINLETLLSASSG
ncbi:Licodione synthase, partial [Linum perenne]